MKRTPLTVKDGRALTRYAGIMLVLASHLFAPAACAGDIAEFLKQKSLFSGVVTDVVTGKPVSGVKILVGDSNTTTDSKGHFRMAGLGDGRSQLVLSGKGILPRTMTVQHGLRTVMEFKVKNNRFNNNMFWASANHDDNIMRWQQPPRWIIYTHYLDVTPAKRMKTSEIKYLKRIIEKELPELSDFFANPDITMVEGRPNEDIRWAKKGSPDGVLLCAAYLGKGGNSGWAVRNGYWVRYSKVRVGMGNQKVWRHEIGHSLGMAHAFDNRKWLPRGDRDKNYEPTKLHNPVEKWTKWDKKWLHTVYSGDRPAGNRPPDNDPDGWTCEPLRVVIDVKPKPDNKSHRLSARTVFQFGENRPVTYQWSSTDSAGRQVGSFSSPTTHTTIWKAPEEGDYAVVVVATADEGRAVASAQLVSSGEGLSPGAVADGDGVLGMMGKGITEAGAMKHMIGVWRVVGASPEKGCRYRVSVKHAASGGDGAFHIVAWSDKDGDGIPETVVGESPLKQALQAGGWSTWEFESESTELYVGTRFEKMGIMFYYSQHAPAGAYSGLGDTMCYTRSAHKMPAGKARPRFTNIRAEILP